MNPKRRLGPQALLLTNPVLLVGSDIDGKPNFTAISWAGMVNSEPPMLSISVRPGRYIHKGITALRCFSVNIPSVDQMSQTDYCGVVSGARSNKAEDCGFTVFRGIRTQTPLIADVPVNLECEVVSIQNLGTHDLIVGRIVEVHVDETCIVDGKPDPGLIRPFTYAGACVRKEYRSLGDPIGQAYSAKLPPRV